MTTSQSPSDITLDVLTFTSCSTLRSCERRYYWRYERGLRPKRDEDADARIQGSLNHLVCAAYLSGGLDAGLAAADEWFAAVPAIGEDMRKRQERKHKARAMIRVVSERWPLNGTVAAVEATVQMPVRNPDGFGVSRTFRYMGKVDGVPGNRLVDWKFVADPGRFIHQAQVGFQTELYAAAVVETYGIAVECCEFRLCVVPTIKLCGKDKTVWDYENRCAEWLQSDPGNLVEHVMYLNPARIEAAKRWLWQCGQSVLTNIREDQWPMNPAACYQWNRECEYARLCVTEAGGGDTADVIAVEYEVGAKHPELAIRAGATDDGDGAPPRPAAVFVE